MTLVRCSAEATDDAEATADDTSTGAVSAVETGGDSTSDPGPIDGTDEDGADSGSDSTEGDTTTDDGEEGDDTTTGGTTTGEPSGDCSPAFTCVETAPNGWEGPFTLQEDGDDCGPGFPTLVWVGGVEAEAEDATCECDCDVTSHTCPTAGLLEYHEAPCPSNWNSTVVMDPVGEGLASLGMLTPGSVRAYPWPSSQGEATCAASVDLEVFPTPSIVGSNRLCGLGPAPTACGDDLEGECIVDSQAPVCLMHEGDVECPVGTYQDRHLYYDDAVVNRECSCGCETETVCPPGAVAGTVQTSNGPMHYGLTADGECSVIPEPGQITTANYFPAAGASTCESEGEISGEVTVAQPRTVCCA
ncbi:MAG: hypothetical protein JKY37_22230 [Nannocystaceae bacterium]|nr:hypothetical protein [Nannocystaceae bacterium]